MSRTLNLDSEELSGDSLFHCCADLGYNMTCLACFSFIGGICLDAPKTLGALKFIEGT